MKILKYEEILEKRRIQRAPMPIGDYLFDKFFDKPSNPKILDKPPTNSNYYTISINFNLKNNNFKSVKELLVFIENYSQRYSINFKISSFASDASRLIFNTYINEHEKVEDIEKLIKDFKMLHEKTKAKIKYNEDFQISFFLVFDPEKIEELKQTEDYINWEKLNNIEIDEFKLKKDVKKYNL